MTDLNLHRQKILFHNILSEKLSLCKFPVVASYTFDKAAQIFSSKIRNGKVLINVNLNFEKGKLFEKEENAADTELFFRAYFIYFYIRFIENAKDLVPESYFSGLVLLDAVKTLEEKKTKRAFMPTFLKKVKNQKPMDVHCTVRALTRMQIEFSEALSPETLKLWDEYLAELLCYEAMPEIEYQKSCAAQFTTASALKNTSELLTKLPETAEKYKIFKDFGITSEKSITPKAIFENDAAAINPFWKNAAARLMLLAPISKNEEALLNNRSLKEVFAALQNDAFEYYMECNDSKNPMIKDNLTAIKVLSRLTDEKIILDENLIKKGRIHSCN